MLSVHLLRNLLSIFARGGHRRATIDEYVVCSPPAPVPAPEEIFLPFPIVLEQPNGALTRAYHTTHPGREHIIPARPRLKRQPEISGLIDAKYSLREQEYRREWEDVATTPRDVNQFPAWLTAALSSGPVQEDAFLNDQPSGEISRADLFAVTDTDCQPDLKDEDATVARQDPGLYSLQQLARQKSA